jgi:hypothetical protein
MASGGRWEEDPSAPLQSADCRRRSRMAVGATAARCLSLVGRDDGAAADVPPDAHATSRAASSSVSTHE